jgi:hypothetical protein
MCFYLLQPFRHTATSRFPLSQQASACVGVVNFWEYYFAGDNGTGDTDTGNDSTLDSGDFKTCLRNLMD